MTQDMFYFERNIQKLNALKELHIKAYSTVIIKVLLIFKNYV